MEWFAFMHPSMRMAARRRTWEECKELVQRLLTEVNDQVFDGMGKISSRGFNGGREGLQLVCETVPHDVASITIIVAVAYDPDALEISSSGLGTVDKEWKVLKLSDKIYDTEDRIVKALQKALLYLEPATASMADRQVG